MIVSDYYDKGTDFSASDFTRPDYQLWVSKNKKKNDDVTQGLEPWVGQLIHNASYNHAESHVIKEFSGSRIFDLEYNIGGSMDRIAFDEGKWFIEDLKSQGMYPAKASFKKPKIEWIQQLSVYRWILQDYKFDVSAVGIIHQYVLGFTKNKDGMERYNKINIRLFTLEETEELIKHKIEVATGAEPVEVTCETWRCSYCDYSDNCHQSNLKGE